MTRQVCGHEGFGSEYENGCYANENDENDGGVIPTAVEIVNANEYETASNDANQGPIFSNSKATKPT
jgi:hypothetical protein